MVRELTANSDSSSLAASRKLITENLEIIQVTMKTSKLIAILLIGITTLHYANAQDSIRTKSKYNCWIYNDTLDLKGVIYSVADSGISFAASISGNRSREGNTKLQYIPVSIIDKIKIRKKNSFGKGMLIGAGVGFFIGGILGFANIPDYGIFETMPPEQNALAGGILFSIPGSIMGGIIGTSKLKIRINRNQDHYQQQKDKISSYAIIQ